MQFLRKFHIIFKIISRNLEENLTQFLGEFNSVLRKFHATFKRI